MANWKLPYSIPKFTSEEFEQQRAEYIAKYGYTIYVPGWEDIVHLPLEKGFTEQEEVRWAAKDWDFFTPSRLEELKAIKERRRKMYLRLLGSPQPKILRNRGSILVALDNNQDALSTLSMIIRIAYTVVPLVWKKILTGPVGWIMTASDILNLCTYVMTPERAAIRTKRIKDAITEKNPFSRKARLKRSMKLFREKIGTGTIIEALQTTDQVFGYGISLGAVMNLPFDMLAGSVRRLDGKPVTMLQPVEQPAFWKTQAYTAWKSLTTLFTTEKIFDVAEALPLMILSHLTAVAAHVITPTLDPNNEIVDLDQYMVKALEPKKSYLREIMQEAGDDPNKFTGWPLTDTKEASCTRIAGEGYNTAVSNFQKWCYDGRYNLETFYGAQRAVDATHFMLATLGGDDAVEYDYIAAEKATHALLDAGYRLPYNLTLKSGYYTAEEDYNYNDIDINYRDDIDYAYDFPDNESKFKTFLVKYYTSETIPRPVLIETHTDPVLSRLKRYGLLNEGILRSTIYTSYQARHHFISLLYTKNLQLSANGVHDIAIPQIIDYLRDYEYIGQTPSTPNFLKYLKETFGILTPQNETPKGEEEP